MANPPPQVPVVILKGWSHLKTQLAGTLPTELQRANRVRRFAIRQLGRGKV